MVMRILQVCPYFHPHVGGVESHVLTLAGELARRGHEVTVLSSRMGKAPAASKLDGFHVKRLRPLAVVAKTPVVPQIEGVVARSDADIVHAHFPPPLCSYYAARGAEEGRHPLVMTYHCDLELPQPLGGAATELYRRSLGAYTVRRAAKVIVTTPTYAATSRAVWRLTPEVIPNSVDDRLFHPSVDGRSVREAYARGGEPVVLFVGRLVRHKGVEYLLEAARRVKDATFLIVGDGDQRPRLQAMAESLGLGGRVHFVGTVPREVLPQYYAACDVFVLPSVSRLEAFGIVALEAMAAGKPVVVTDIPGVREVITPGEEGVLADPMNPEDLAEKTAALLDDTASRRTMGAKGRRRVEAAFTAAAVAKRVEGVYGQVLQV